MSATNTELPGTLHELMALALQDVKKCLDAPNTYVLDMNDWHNPNTEGQCFVCMAGAVMAQTLHADPHWYKGPTSYDWGTEKKLSAVNFVRTGMIYTALHLVARAEGLSEEDLRGKRKDCQRVDEAYQMLQLEMGEALWQAPTRQNKKKWFNAWQHIVDLLKECNL